MVRRRATRPTRIISCARVRGDMVGGFVIIHRPSKISSIGYHAVFIHVSDSPADSLGDIGLELNGVRKHLLAEIGRYQRAREVRGSCRSMLWAGTCIIIWPRADARKRRRAGDEGRKLRLRQL